MTAGERGPTGDHGQDGADGKAGPKGDVGKSVLSKPQTLFGFLFVVFCFVVLAYRSETQSKEIYDIVDRQDRILSELCDRGILDSSTLACKLL